MNFEKWQALGNDYVILDERTIPFELTPGRIRRLCAAHTGIASDGILLISAPDEPGFVANMRVFNPDGSEAELSGNGAREAILFLRRRRWTEQNRFSIKTVAGEIRAQITSPTTCTVDMGRARLSSGDYPSGEPDGRGELSAAGRTWSFQHIQIGNPQCSIEVESENDLERLDLPAIGHAFEYHELFPNRTNVSWYTVLGARAHPRPHLRARRGRDLGERHRRDRRCGRVRAQGRRLACDGRARRRGTGG